MTFWYSWCLQTSLCRQKGESSQAGWDLNLKSTPCFKSTGVCEVCLQESRPSVTLNTHWLKMTVSWWSLRFLFYLSRKVFWLFTDETTTDLLKMVTLKFFSIRIFPACFWLSVGFSATSQVSFALQHLSPAFKSLWGLNSLKTVPESVLSCPPAHCLTVLHPVFMHTASAGACCTKTEVVCAISETGKIIPLKMNKTWRWRTYSIRENERGLKEGGQPSVFIMKGLLQLVLFLMSQTFAASSLFSKMISCNFWK